MTKRFLHWNTSRRALLKRGLQLPFAGAATAWVVSACGNSGGACYDSASAPAEAKAMRDSFHYAEASPDASKTCAGCGFFSTEGGACGVCQIFNGPANAAGHCDSWAAKT